jgi:hypothetical protein
MNLVEKVMNIFILKTALEQENEISEIGDLFEYSNVEKSEVVLAVDLLLSLAVQNIGESVKESLLNAINNALVYQNAGSEAAFEILLPCLCGYEELTYVLSFFGFSGNPKYKSILKSYSVYKNEEIREAAQKALFEIDNGKMMIKSS